MALTENITAEWLRSRVSYDPITGVMTWTDCTKEWLNGCVLGGISKQSGYRLANFGKRPIAVHRLIWLYVHGTWPAHEVDHINGVRADNRLCNLREATRAQNACNRPAQGGRLLKGITKTKYGWHAQIRHGGRNLYLGKFATAEEAHAVYAAKATELHGEFARPA